jgi:hypothetical protein
MPRVVAGFVLLTVFVAHSVAAQDYEQLGLDIDVADAVDSGGSVSLSSDGSVLAIGGPGSDGTGTYAGRVRVFEWDGAAWVQRGGDIDGEAADDWSGSSVSLSSDGSILAIGAFGNDGTGTDAGHVRVYKFDPTIGVDRETIPGPDILQNTLMTDAYPNPFRRVMRVRVQLTRYQDVQLTVHDLLGRQIAMLNEGFLGQGVHEVEWDATGWPNGVYFYRLSAGGFVQSKAAYLSR